MSSSRPGFLDDVIAFVASDTVDRTQDVQDTVSRWLAVTSSSDHRCEARTARAQKAWGSRAKRHHLNRNTRPRSYARPLVPARARALRSVGRALRSVAMSYGA